MQPAENKDYSRDVILRLSPIRNTIIVEEQKPGGIAAYREIDPLELYYVINQSYASNDYLDSGFLPEHCLHLSMSATEKYFVLWNPELRADVIYGDKEYPNFPIPRMVFGVRVLENGKVAECSMGVVADETPTVDMSKYVLKLLESYNERERKIAVLRYNLEHPAKVSRSEQIEAMNFGHGDGLDHSAGHISNKTLYIALNYEEQAERMNAESAHEIAKELFALECEQRRLTYFIGLLDKRQAEVIRLVFVDGIPTKEVAASFGLTYRTIDRIKRTAIENLAEMYAYSDQFRV